MDLILLVFVLALIGLCVWLITTRIPMPEPWPRLLQTLALCVVIFYLIARFAAVPNVLP